MKILSFRLQEELFGIELTYVKEINRNIEFTSVPRSQKNIVGLFNMRGKIVTIFNLAEILGYDVTLTEDRATCIILKSIDEGPDIRGFLIDKSGDVIDVNEEICEKAPANMDMNETKYIKMIVRLDTELLRVIDPESLT
jgi:purine-binding chemotaxis protein CheW